MSNLSDDEMLAVATRLTRGAGRSSPRALERIAGGRNNRVYRLDLEDGSALVLKSYHADPRDPRDRLAAEWDFITYAWNHGVRNLPEPLACERDGHIGLYSFVAGEKLKPADVAWLHLDAAASFVGAVNQAPRNLDLLNPGSEACFSLAAHITTVEKRIDRLATLDHDAPMRDAAEVFIETHLRPAWFAVKTKLQRSADAFGISLDETLSPEEICASPSDFGFHNALVVGDNVSFIDFEYAGRDDPAKLVCDFFCQPEIPIPIEHFDRFVARILDLLSLDADCGRRCALLLDTYRIKWLCIILNDFLPTDASRRMFGEMGSDRAMRCEAQLAKAQARLALVSLA